MRCSAQSCDFQQQTVFIGLSRSRKVNYAFEQAWVARTLQNRIYFETGWEGGLLHPSMCLHPVFVSTPWADYRRQGQRQGQSCRDWVSSTSPGPATAPRALGVLAVHPQVTHAAAVSLAFLGFCFCCFSAATSVPHLGGILHCFCAK